MSLFKLCNPKGDTQCQKDLTQCQSDKVNLQSQLVACNQAQANLADQLKTANGGLAQAQAQTAALQKQYDDLAALDNLMKQGPPPPAKENLRVLSQAILNDLLWKRLGQKYIDCQMSGAVHFSWPPWLIGKKDDLDRYCQFFKDLWLPLLQPYTVLDWVDTHGNKVQIAGRACSDFSDNFGGIPSLYLNWCPLPWGVFWAVVDGFFISGGHGFNFCVTWDSPYDETNSNGLTLWNIEPQTSGDWTIEGKAVNESAKIEDITPKPIEDTSFNYVIKNLMMVKV